MRFLIRAHQGKEEPYLQALLIAGHQMALAADCVLIDFEIPHPGYERYVNYARDRGIPLIAYPHGFAQVGEHQLTREPHECALAFVHGPGQVELRLRYGYPNPVQAVGYPGPREPIVPREPTRVLFAPHHPLGSGWMPDEARLANTSAFRTLLQGEFELGVRYIGTMEQNGIWEETGVAYHAGRMDGSLTEGYDVVVAGGTYAANSLCHGLPVVMYNQEREWRVELEGQESRMVPDWVRWESRTRYPYDLSERGIESAAQDLLKAEREEWMEVWMPPFEPELFARKVEEICLSRVS